MIRAVRGWPDRRRVRHRFHDRACSAVGIFSSLVLAVVDEIRASLDEAVQFVSQGPPVSLLDDRVVDEGATDAYAERART
jgi:hypothetical protein